MKGDDSPRGVVKPSLATVVDGIHVAAVIQDHPRALRMPVCAAEVQRGVAAVVRSKHVCFGREQQAHHFRVVVLACKVERGVLPHVPRVWVDLLCFAFFL